MKVAIFSFDIDRAFGTGNITYELCSEFTKKGIDFILFLPKSEGENRASNKDDYPFPVKYVLPEPFVGIKEAIRKKIIWEYFKNIDLSGFTLVHCLFAFPHSFMAARCAKKNKLPFIMGAQGTYGVRPLDHWPAKILLKKSYKEAKEIIVPSQFTRDKIKEYANENYNISIIHNGVNFNKFENKPDIKDLEEKYKNNKILVTVGGLIPRKGQDLIIKALPKIKIKYPDIKYLIVGGGRQESFLKQLAKDYNVEDNVELLGRVSDKELIEYYHLCDIYVHTPRVINLSFEGFGIVYLEVSACNKPIVASDAGGIRDAVVDGKTGLIAKDENIDDIADKINYLLSNEGLRRKMGEDGKQYAREHDWSIISDKFIDKYKKYSL